MPVTLLRGLLLLAGASAFVSTRVAFRAPPPAARSHVPAVFQWSAPDSARRSHLKLSASESGPCEEGERALTSALEAFQGGDLRSARAAAETARQLYAAADDPELRSSRAPLCAQIVERIDSLEAREASSTVPDAAAGAVAAARRADEFARRQRSEGILDESLQRQQRRLMSADGDELFQRAVAALAAEEYTNAHVLAEDARRAYEANGPSLSRDRAPALANLCVACGGRVAARCSAQWRTHALSRARKSPPLLARIRNDQPFLSPPPP